MPSSRSEQQLHVLYDTAQQGSGMRKVGSNPRLSEMTGSSAGGTPVGVPPMSSLGTPGGSAMRKISSTPRLDLAAVAAGTPRAANRSGQFQVLGMSGNLLPPTGTPRSVARSGQMRGFSGQLSGPVSGNLVRGNADTPIRMLGQEDLPTLAQFATLNRSGQLRLLAQLGSPTAEGPATPVQGPDGDTLVLPRGVRSGQQGPILRHSRSMAVRGTPEPGQPGDVEDPSPLTRPSLRRSKTRARVFFPPDVSVPVLPQPPPGLSAAQLTRQRSRRVLLRSGGVSMNIRSGAEAVAAAASTQASSAAPSGPLQRQTSRRMQSGRLQFHGIAGAGPSAGAAAARAPVDVEGAPVEETSRRRGSRAVSGPLYYA